jgi:hypothetical protein
VGVEEAARLMAARKQREREGEECLGLNISFKGMSPLTYSSKQPPPPNSSLG